MPRDLFGTVIDPPAALGAQSRVTLPLSLAGHAAALAALVVAPLVATNTLPLPGQVVTVLLPSAALPPEPPQPTPPAVARTASAPATAARPADPPLAVPTGARAPEDAGPTDLSFVSTGATGDGTGTGIFGAGRGEPLVTPPPPQPPRAEPATVRVGGAIIAPRKVFDVAPVYPTVPLASRIEGVSIIQATIGVDGRVVDAQVLRPAPLFDQAALDAVRQWRYTPTQLNGDPVAVIMTVTVSFRLR